MLSALLKHGLMTMSLKQIQITKEFIIHYERKTNKRGWVLMYIRNGLTYKYLSDSSISDGNREILTI